MVWPATSYLDLTIDISMKTYCVSKYRFINDSESLSEFFLKVTQIFPTSYSTNLLHSKHTELANPAWNGFQHTQRMTSSSCFYSMDYKTFGKESLC